MEEPVSLLHQEEENLPMEKIRKEQDNKRTLK
jgi:hypothetical protein